MRYHNMIGLKSLETHGMYDVINLKNETRPYAIAHARSPLGL